MDYWNVKSSCSCRMLLLTVGLNDHSCLDAGWLVKLQKPLFERRPDGHSEGGGDTSTGRHSRLSSPSCFLSSWPRPGWIGLLVELSFLSFTQTGPIKVMHTRSFSSSDIYHVLGRRPAWVTCGFLCEAGRFEERFCDLFFKIKADCLLSQTQLVLIGVS